jgi:type III pantothenate kinase
VNRLLIDAGNTNIKLVSVTDGNWQPVCQWPSHRAGDLSRYLDGRAVCRAQQVWVSNVAGAEVAQQIKEACAARHWPLQFIAAKAAQCGVHNGYLPPAQLGCDRWAALIAAWHSVGRACLVVTSGTATTIDALSDRGEFLGGLILPGIELMQRSLIAAADGLQAAGGGFAGFPRNTADALLSGAIQASCGAIQRQHTLLDVEGAPVLLSGGAARMLSPHLNLSVQMVDNLVLQGLLLIAQEAEKA